MTKLHEIYKCEICGNIVAMVHEGAGQLVCCGEPMKLQNENTIDASLEKHVPVIEKTNNGILVKIGEQEHPMTNEHYIEWIEVLTKDSSFRHFLRPSDKSESRFFISEGMVAVRAYCNLHRLWKK